MRGLGERWRLSGTASFWLLACLLGVLMFAASAPSPLYVVYQAHWHFTATTLTAVFAVYALVLLLALTVTGPLSDHVGRRPVLIAALLVGIVSMTVFVAAQGTAALYIARALQGLATGLATGAISAGLVDLGPRSRPALASLVNATAPMFGLAAGAIASGALVQFAPAPMRLVYWVLLVVFAAGLLGIVAMPEPAPRRSGALRSLVPRVAVPAGARRTFALQLPCLVAVWALGGLYLSLAPSLVAGTLHHPSHLTGGLAIATLTAAGGVAALTLRELAAPSAMKLGSCALALGVGVTLLALANTSTVLFEVGAAIAGVGFGLGFMGAFRTLVVLAPSQDRAALIAAIYVVSYLAFSVPAIIAGLAVTHDGLRPTADAYGAIVAGLALASAVATASAHRVTGRPGEN